MSDYRQTVRKQLADTIYRATKCGPAWDAADAVLDAFPSLGVEPQLEYLVLNGLGHVMCLERTLEDARRVVAQDQAGATKPVRKILQRVKGQPGPWLPVPSVVAQ